MCGMIGKLHSTVLDCPDPDALARFYEELLGLARFDADDDWVTIGVQGQPPYVAFQRVEGYTPPQWPGQVVPQQFHLDVQVDDLDDGQKKVLAIGATSAGYEQKDFRVFLDPAGHPFCLVTS